MCGISGLLTTESYALKAEEFLKQSLIVNQLRGMHSTGLFQIGTKGDIDLFKKAVHASDFIDVKEAKDLIGKAGRSRLTVGHVRHATVGAKDKDENAHPFVITREDGSQLVGVHNGSLRNWKFKKGSKDVEVDSAWAFQMLADEGADAFEYFDGAFAFVWYDTRTPDVVYMARNKERPLHYFVTEDKKSMYFMSELGSLGWIGGRNELKKNTEIGFRYLDPGLIYKFSLKEIGEHTSAAFPSYDPKTTITPPVTPYNNYGNYGRRYDMLNDYYGDDNDWGDSHSGENFRRGWNPHGQTPGYIQRDYNADRTDGILERVKEALKQARNKTDAPSEEEVETLAVVTNDDLEVALAEAVRTFQEEKEGKKATVLPLSTLSTPMFIGSPVDTAAEHKEKALIQDMAMYGMIVDFSGILFDEEDKSVEGEATVYQNGKWIKAEATLRNITGQRAKFLYTGNRHPQRVAIIGYDNDPGRGLPAQYVVAELTPDQRNLILNKAGKLAVSH